MKKNWMQVVTLCLCGILMAVTLVQGKQLNEIQRQMDDRMGNLSPSSSVRFGIFPMTLSANWRKPTRSLPNTY